MFLRNSLPGPIQRQIDERLDVEAYSIADYNSDDVNSIAEGYQNFFCVLLHHLILSLFEYNLRIVSQ
jgi:hypothetical protein